MSPVSFCLLIKKATTKKLKYNVRLRSVIWFFFHLLIVFPVPGTHGKLFVALIWRSQLWICKLNYTILCDQIWREKKITFHNDRLISLFFSSLLEFWHHKLYFTVRSTFLFNADFGFFSSLSYGVIRDFDFKKKKSIILMQ